MNNQDNKLTISVLSTLCAGIALVYTLIQYHNVLFAVIGVSVIFLITAYLLTQNVIVWITMRNKSNSVQIKTLADDISSQLENMSSSQAAIGKSTYAYTKQTAKIITGLDEKYTESQEALFRSLSTIASNNNKATKLIVKHNQNNASKTIAAMKDLRVQINDILTQGFDQIQPDNSEIIDTLNTLVEYLKSQSSNNMDSTMGLQLNNVAHELQNISNSIQHFQMPVATVMPTMPTAPMSQPAPVNTPAAENTTAAPIQVKEEPVVRKEPELNSDPEKLTQADLDALLGSINNTLDESANITEEPAAVEEAPVTEEAAPVEDTPVAEEAAAVEEVAVVEEAAPVEEPPTLDDPNKQLSADEIAALFAAAEPAPAKEEAPATEKAAETDKPEFTVISNDEAAPTLDDPNKQLSADEIAALFAAAEPAPAKAEPSAEPVEAPVLDDPNKQLSADEIAALFAAAEPAPAKEEEPAPEPVAITPVSDDPNKQLSADEIAALFAQMG